ncbi:hypothetical protein [Flavisolibacter nicotianae]|uniref:hypothetical protein n=1 Tax=Flavisolibacter nicotianae TaxID=2364882 RepID=UPI000EB36DAC|nr:hypothetical protein [Flavisolibacter nicotianae]
MKWIDLTDADPYKPVSEVDIADSHFDLHNDFRVLRTEYSSFDHYAALYFESDAAYGLLLFLKSTLSSWKMLSGTIDTTEDRSFDFFTRVFGIEDAEGFWTELPRNRKFFQVAFTDTSEIMIEAERVLFVDLGIELLKQERAREIELENLERSIKKLEIVLTENTKSGEEPVKEHLQRRLDNRRELYQQKARHQELDQQWKAALREHRQLLTGCF